MLDLNCTDQSQSKGKKQMKEEKSRSKKETQSINIRFPKSDLDKIRKLAEDDGRTINNYICRIIRKYLDNHLENSDNLD